MEPNQTTVEKSGRVLIPAAIRHKVGLRAGERLLVDIAEDGSVRLRTRLQILAEIREEVRKRVPPGKSLSEELIRERRREATREWKRG